MNVINKKIISIITIIVMTFGILAGIEFVKPNKSKEANASTAKFKITRATIKGANCKYRPSVAFTKKSGKYEVKIKSYGKNKYAKRSVNFYKVVFSGKFKGTYKTKKRNFNPYNGYTKGKSYIVTTKANMCKKIRSGSEYNVKITPMIKYTYRYKKNGKVKKRTKYKSLSPLVKSNIKCTFTTKSCNVLDDSKFKLDVRVAYIGPNFKYSNDSNNIKEHFYYRDAVQSSPNGVSFYFEKKDGSQITSNEMNQIKNLNYNFENKNPDYLIDYFKDYGPMVNAKTSTSGRQIYAEDDWCAVYFPNNNYIAKIKYNVSSSTNSVEGIAKMRIYNQVYRKIETVFGTLYSGKFATEGYGDYGLTDFDLWDHLYNRLIREFKNLEGYKACTTLEEKVRFLENYVCKRNVYARTSNLGGLECTHFYNMHIVIPGTLIEDGVAGGQGVFDLVTKTDVPYSKIRLSRYLMGIGFGSCTDSQFVAGNILKSCGDIKDINKQVIPIKDPNDGIYHKVYFLDNNGDVVPGKYTYTPMAVNNEIGYNYGDNKSQWIEYFSNDDNFPLIKNYSKWKGLMPYLK